jgi:hypothetical protein
MKSQQNFSQPAHPIHPIEPQTHVFAMFRSVWVYLGLFRYCTKLGAKQAFGAINPKVRATKSHRNFSE